jgi:hypothetical protein
VCSVCAEEDAVTVVSTEVRAVIDVPRDRLFAWAVPGVFGNELETIMRRTFLQAGVDHVSGMMGPWDLVGTTRVVHSQDATTTFQEVTAHDAAAGYFAYRLSRFTHWIGRFVHEGRGQWWFEPRADGATDVRWKHTYLARSLLAVPVVALPIKVLWHRHMDAGIRALKARAETELR